MQHPVGMRIRITVFTVPYFCLLHTWLNGLSSSSFVFQRRQNNFFSQKFRTCCCNLQQDDNNPIILSSTQLEDSNKDSLDDTLKELNKQFNYAGRLPSDYFPTNNKHKQQNQTPNVEPPSSSFPFRCGFISLVGAPNMGKSSLVNALLEEELCIATHRPQTTRHAILAILNSPPEFKCQLCFLDTPGVIDKPAYKLQEGMMEAVQGAFQDADVLLIVTDIFSTPIPNDVLFQRVVYLSKMNQKKVIVAINKVDLLDKAVAKKQRAIQENLEQGEGGIREEMLERPFTIRDAIMHWRELLPDAIAIIPMCASKGGKDMGVVALRTLLMGGPDVTQAFRNVGGPYSGMFLPNVSMITEEYAKQIIPVSPPLYSKDTLTDRNSRYVVLSLRFVVFI